MKKAIGMISLIFGVIACVLAFTGYFKTPPLAITVFSVLGVVSGIYAIKQRLAGGVIGIVISIIAFVYLLVLFIGLG